jgi:hypothetical protein
MITLSQRIPNQLIALMREYAKYNILTREPNQVIRRHGEDYIKRYMLGRKIMVPINDTPGMPIGWMGGIQSEIENIYLHEFIRSDKDDPHNHPWPNVTVLIRGWYSERIFTDDGIEKGEVNRHPGDIVIRKASDVHAITYTSDNCLSLFITGRKETEWGFWQDNKFIHWENYHANSAG